MGRASFGGAADNSQLFAALFNQYQDRLTSLTNQAADRAKEEQRAADNDLISQWQNGDITDEAFLAYAQKRIADTANDPTENAYWKNIQRETQQGIDQQRVSDTAASIVSGIQAGTKTYSDLLAYYQSEQKKLRPSDPLYDELKGEIGKVNDQIAQNKVTATINGIDYNFRAGHVTGKEAGAALRATAQQYKVNDPQRYYDLLGTALEYEHFGGFYGAGTSGASGGGSGRSGGGSGRSTASLNGLIDATQGVRNVLGSLSDQFEKGITVGRATYESADGSLVTEEVVLRNPDGTPTDAMKSIDQQWLDNEDALIAAYDQKGDRSARDGAVNAKMDYITGHIQPRNTIGPELQAGRLFNAFQQTVEGAVNSGDPVTAWSQVHQAAAQITTWRDNLNNTQRKAQDVSNGHFFEGTDKGQTLQTPNPLEGQTTGEFIKQADALVAATQAIANAKDAASLSSAQQSLVDLVGADQASAIIQRMSAAVDVVTGIPQGKYVRAYIPGEGYVFTPMVTTFQNVLGPDGNPTVETSVHPQFPKGFVDPEAGDVVQPLFADIGGKTQLVYGVSRRTFYGDGQVISAAEYQKNEARLQELTNKTTLTPDERTEKQNLEAANFQAYSMLEVDNNGTTERWLSDSNGMWHRNQVTKYGGVPIIFAGSNAKEMQRIASTTINKATGQPFDPTGKKYWNADLHVQGTAFAGSIDPLVGGLKRQRFNESNWYDISEAGARQEAMQAQRAKIGALAVGGAAAGGVMGSMFGNAGAFIQQSAQSLGINLGAPLTAGRGFSGFQPGIDARPTPTAPRPIAPLPSPLNLGGTRAPLPKINVPAPLPKPVPSAPLPSPKNLGGTPAPKILLPPPKAPTPAPKPQPTAGRGFSGFNPYA